MFLSVRDHAELRAVAANLAALRAEVATLRRRRPSRKFDPGQPRVPAGSPDGGQWTSGGAGGGEASFEQVLFNPRRAVIQRGVKAALSLFAGLLASNGAGGQAFIAFNATEFRVDADADRPMSSSA